MSHRASVITIDGPSGSGKGTISRRVSEATGFSLLDSGALYRLTGLACQRAGVDLSDEEAVAEVAARLNIRFDSMLDKTRIVLDGEDATQAIRTEEMGFAASAVGANKKARAALLQRQRDFRQPPGLVADGRDMGTVVFTDAELKIFLTASAEERARRRVLQLRDAGATTVDEEQVLADIKARDQKDSSRAVAPLIPAADALIIDSTKLAIDEVVARIMQAIKQRALL